MSTIFTAAVVSPSGASHEIGLAPRDVRQRDVEHVTVERGVDHHAVDHRPPVVDPRFDDARLLRQALHDRRRDEVVDPDVDLAVPAVDVDPRFGLLVREPGAVALVRPQLDDLDAVHPFLPRRWRFHSWSHACAASSDPEADDRHVPIVPGPSLELQPDLLEVRWRERVRERRDLHERLAERPVEEPVRSGALDPDVFNREVDPSSC
jgi:hypothetical protein